MKHGQDGIDSLGASATDLASKNILQPVGSQGKDVVGVWRVEEQSGYSLPV